jgi:hypothetical protein
MARPDFGIFLDGAPRSPAGTLLWEVDVGGGAKYWVSAPNHVDALLIAAQHDALDGLPWDNHLSVEVVTEKRLDAIGFTEDGGARVPMRQEWLRDPSPRLVATDCI